MPPFPQSVAFWAQSADNVSPDRFEWDGDVLAEDDPRRQDVQRAVYEVTKAGEELVGKDSSRAVLHGDRFVIQSVGDDRDDEGRLAPLVILGMLPEHEDDTWIRGIVERTSLFLQSLGRDASDQRLGKIRRWIYDLIEKKKRRRARRIAIGLAVGAVLLFVGYIASRA